MSLFGNISMMNQAMLNYQNGLNVLANNLANANTPGYTREAINLASLDPIQDGPLQFGQGAYGTSVVRLRNLFLDNVTRLQLSDLGKAEAHSTALEELKMIFPEIATPGVSGGIQEALTTLAADWADLATAPGNAIKQATVRDALDTLAQRLNQDSHLLYDLQTNLDTDVANTISQINTLSDQIASLNKQIVLAKAAGQGQDPNTLLDARELAAEKLSQLVGGNYFIVSDGSMTVSTSGGILVSGGNAFHFKAMPSASDPGRTAVGYYDNAKNVLIDMTSRISGGKLCGLIQARDIDCEEAILAIDKIAFGMIQKTNEINRTAIAFDGTTNHAIYTGTKASDIALDFILRDPTKVGYIGGTRDVAGDTAKIQAQMQSMMMYSGIQSTPFNNINTGVAVLDPNVSIGILRAAGAFVKSPLAAPALSLLGNFTIKAGGNSVTVRWDDSTTINQIIQQINLGGGGAIQATYAFDPGSNNYKMFIYTNAPTTVMDNNLDFCKAMALSAVVFSSAPINNNPTANLNKVVSAQALNSVTNTLDLFTDPSPMPSSGLNYSAKFDNSVVTWLPTNTISALLNNITTSTPVGNKIYKSLNPNTQVVTLVKTGEQALNGGILSVANPLTSISIADQTGNLSRIFNFDTTENSSRIFSEMTTAMSSRADSETVLKSQAQSLVDNTQNLQDQTASVNLNIAAEMEQARVFQRSFEACVRLQGIMDEMLNVLINKVGTASSTNSFS